MSKPIGFLPILVLGLVSTVVSIGTLRAAPVTYTEDATATGSLNGVPFTNASVVLTMNNDTTNVAGGPTIFFNLGTSTVEVGAGPPVIFTGVTDVAANHSASSFGFGSLTTGKSIFYS